MSCSRTGWPWLLLAAATLTALQLWLRPLLPVDETRYLGVAWEMWWRGDYLVPHLNGDAYSHKPPLLFWLINAVWSLTGVSGLAARLLPVLVNILNLWLCALLAKRLWPQLADQVAVLAPWLLFGGVFWMNFYALVQFDGLLVLAALIAWLGLLRTPLQPLAGWGLFAFGVACGGLAKGPVILVPVLPALLCGRCWLAAAPQGWLRWYVSGLAALLTGVALVLLWAVPAGQAGGEAYRQAIFWGQSAGRVVDAFAHRSPWWSYLLWLPLMWLPWLLWPPLWRGLRRLSFADPGLRFCLAVWLPALLLFSLISGKQPKYLLPLLPLLAVLMARLLAETQASAYLGTRTLAVLLAALGLLLTVLPWWPHGPDWLEDVQCWWGAALVLSALVFFRLRWRRNQAVRVMVLGVWLGTASLYLGIIAPLAPRYGVQALSSQLAELQSAGRPLAWLGKYHGQFQFAGRLTSRIQPLAGGEQLRNWLAAHVDGYVLVNYRTEGVALPADLLSYPYRSGKLVLWPAQRLLDLPAQLDALAGNA